MQLLKELIDVKESVRAITLQMMLDVLVVIIV
jgi:hypothetical protein